MSENTKSRAGRKRDPSVESIKSNKTEQIDLLRQALAWFFNDRMFAEIKTHGNIKWTSRSLVKLAILMAWSDASQLTEAFTKAASLSNRLYGTLAVATYQGLMRALVTYGPQLVPVIWSRLQCLMQRSGAEHFRIGIWLPLAVDGSRFTTPRTQSNEETFSAKNYGKGKKARSRKKWKNKKKRSKKLGTPVKPQIWLTLIWHMGLKLSWCWKSGPSTSSERDHLIELLKSCVFPEKTLFCCDAGFVGYELWSAIAGSGHSFLIRVGGNVHLLKNLGHARTGDGIVSLWPDEAARKKQPPIVLRLIEIKGSKGSMFLVTNVLSKRQLSDGALRKLYPLRWGIEIQFRSTKQTFGRSKLRCRNSNHALAELDWSLVALTLVQLFAIKEQVKLNEPPDNMSVASALKAIRHAMNNWNEPAQGPARMDRKLQKATKDTYNRASDKDARYKPKFKDKPSTTKPIVKQATEQQQQRYDRLFLAT